MTATTEHAIRLMTGSEALAYALAGWARCVRGDCEGDAVYYARRDNHGKPAWDRLCVSHGATYANRHGLTLPPLPQRTTDHTAPLPASVVARGADTDSTHGVK